ncbi:hypothetical protein GCM10025865_18320 [Paraoerskovia sediminicola]|uniref:Uncharacterized protein n=1 Tax=Paraoerskovia sediminicola TaxID=1138587 RepID=A0ABN6XGC1_9CELL|nr:hypothetical protein [Paraoerskovia sediminicola]BDZ42533.1 hypothetical protein GCM10025865_18320 [Paraoerskovia sediminicola]
MTTLDERQEAVAVHERRATRAVTNYVIGGTWYIGIWYFAVAVVGAAIIVVIEVSNDGVGINPATGPAGSARFFLFVMGILLPLMLMPVHLAAGGTRRTLTRGFLVGGAAVGVMFAAAATLVVLLQPWVLDLLGVGTGRPCRSSRSWARRSRSASSTSSPATRSPSATTGSAAGAGPGC